MVSGLAGRFFTSEPPGKPSYTDMTGIKVGPAPRGALGGSEATSDARAALGPQSEFLQGIWLEMGFILLLFDKHRQHIKKQRHYFANKDPSSQGYGFSSSHVWM